jgi:hypothetical protein
MPPEKIPSNDIVSYSYNLPSCEVKLGIDWKNSGTYARVVTNSKAGVETK